MKKTYLKLAVDNNTMVNHGSYSDEEISSENSINGMINFFLEEVRQVMAELPDPRLKTYRLSIFESNKEGEVVESYYSTWNGAPEVLEYGVESMNKMLQFKSWLIKENL